MIEPARDSTEIFTNFPAFSIWWRGCRLPTEMSQRMLMKYNSEVNDISLFSMPYDYNNKESQMSQFFQG